MINVSYDNLRQNLVKQYSKLDNRSKEQVIEQLGIMDFKSEFRKLNKLSKIYKIILIIGSILALGLFLFKFLALSNTIMNNSIDLFQPICAIAFLAIVFMSLLNKISLKIRLLGLLYEFYKK